MNMFARFDENPAMTLQVIKETKRYRRTDAQRHNRMQKCGLNGYHSLAVSTFFLSFEPSTLR